MVIKELDTVVLVKDLPEYGLRVGDIGAVVHLSDDGSTFDVEFVSGGGDTVALVALTPADVRLLDQSEIMHARKLG